MTIWKIYGQAHLQAGGGGRLVFGFLVNQTYLDRVLCLLSFKFWKTMAKASNNNAYELGIVK